VFCYSNEDEDIKINLYSFGLNFYLLKSEKT
jgi:hypothetical protein